jgi:hypothetical protein
MLVLVIFLFTTVSGQSKKNSISLDSAIYSRYMPLGNGDTPKAFRNPNKPGNAFEVGASFGSVAINGDIPAVVPSLGLEAHIRKALGYVFSLRLQYFNGTAEGLNWKASANYQKNPAWLSAANGGYLNGVGYIPTRNTNGTVTTGEPIFQNFKSNIQDLSLQGIITLNNIGFHRQGSQFVVYTGGGVGFTAYNTKVNALDAAGLPYSALFQKIYPSSGIKENKGETLKALKNGMDKTYETPAENEDPHNAKTGGNSSKLSGVLLAGIALKLTDRINIALEDRHTFMKTDLLDGSQWQEHPAGDATQTRSFDTWNYISLGVNFNIGAKSAEPLWWLNPLDYAYSELLDPSHLDRIFADTDGDGVIDRFDREPHTPAGCPVDTHGVSRDTDGDGVADCKDKELITPSECRPVDSNGVGKCLESAIAKAGMTDPNFGCPTNYPSIPVMKTDDLNNDVKALLTIVANKLKNNPGCSITITAYPDATRELQALLDKKLAAIKNYLVTTSGISPGRILTFRRIGGGDPSAFNIKSN